MNKRVLLRILRLAFDIAGRVAPRFTGRKAFDLFCTKQGADFVDQSLDERAAA